MSSECCVGETRLGHQCDILGSLANSDQQLSFDGPGPQEGAAEVLLVLIEAVEVDPRQTGSLRC